MPNPFNRTRGSSIADFCDRYGITPSTFYRNRSDMPLCIKVGGQIRITEADEQLWLKRKQAQAQTGRAA